MATAVSEISHVREFDYVLVNNVLDEAVAEAQAVLTASRLKLDRLVGLDAFTAEICGGDGMESQAKATPYQPT